MGRFLDGGDGGRLSLAKERSDDAVSAHTRRRQAWLYSIHIEEQIVDYDMWSGDRKWRYGGIVGSSIKVGV